jgi:hypothetical protein
VTRHACGLAGCDGTPEGHDLQRGKGSGRPASCLAVDPVGVEAFRRAVTSLETPVRFLWGGASAEPPLDARPGLDTYNDAPIPMTAARLDWARAKAKADPAYAAGLRFAADMLRAHSLESRAAEAPASVLAEYVDAVARGERP